jgi:predicted ribosomally synthesized peptide with SipW-like signal peptide
MNIINKRIAGLTIACLLLIGMVSGSVWAYFNDVETASNNGLAAGTLDMVPSTSGTGPVGKYTVTGGGNGVNGNVVFTKMRPGESGTITWVLTNNGSLPGTLTLSSTVTFAENGSNEIETAVSGNNGGGNGDLDAYVGVRVKRNGTYFLGDASNYVSFSDLEAKLDAESQALAASGTITYVLEWSIASDIKGAGADGKFGTVDDVDVNENIIQSDTAQIDITFTLNQ